MFSRLFQGAFTRGTGRMLSTRRVFRRASQPEWKNYLVGFGLVGFVVTVYMRSIGAVGNKTDEMAELAAVQEELDAEMKLRKELASNTAKKGGTTK